MLITIVTNNRVVHRTLINAYAVESLVTLFTANSCEKARLTFNDSSGDDIEGFLRRIEVATLAYSTTQIQPPITQAAFADARNKLSARPLDCSQSQSTTVDCSRLVFRAQCLQQLVAEGLQIQLLDLLLLLIGTER